MKHILTSVKALAASGDAIYTNEMTSYAQAIKETSGPGTVIEILTNSENAYFDVRTAQKLGCTVIVDGKKIKGATGSTTLFRKLLALVEFANTGSKLDDITASLTSSSVFSSEYPAKLSKNALIALVKNTVEHKDRAAHIVSKLHKAIEHKEEEIKQYHMAAVLDDEIEVVYIDYKDLGSLADKDGIHILAGGTGSGKTKYVMGPTFDDEAAAGSMPIQTTGSISLSKSALKDKIADNVWYKYATHDDTAKGVIGVAIKTLTDSMLMTKRDESEVFLADEFESQLDLISSDLMKSLDALVTVNKAMDAQIAQSRLVVIADAMLSKNGLERIKHIAKTRDEKINQKITVYMPKSKRKLAKVRVFKNLSSAVGETRDELKRNGRAFVFCDAKHRSSESVFTKRYNALRDAVDGNEAVMVDGAFNASAEADELENATGFADDYKLIVGNTAIENGLSIEHKEYKTTTLLAHGTTSPAGLLQASNRARMTEVINLKLSLRGKRRLFTNPIKVLTSLINEKAPEDITSKEYGAYFADETLNMIAERIAYSNRARMAYGMYALTMFRQKGHELEYDSEDHEEGQAAIERGSKEEEDSRVEGITSAASIDADTAKEYSNNESVLTESQRHQLENHRLSNYYQAPVTEELITFDKKGYTRVVLDNIKRTQGEKLGKSTKENLKTQVAETFYSIATEEVNGELRITSHTCKAAMDYVKKGKIEHKEQEISVSDIFFEMYDGAKLHGYSLAFVKDILTKHLGHEIGDSKKVTVTIDGKKTKPNACAVKVSDELTAVLAVIKKAKEEKEAEWQAAKDEREAERVASMPAKKTSEEEKAERDARWAKHLEQARKDSENAPEAPLQQDGDKFDQAISDLIN